MSLSQVTERQAGSPRSSRPPLGEAEYPHPSTPLLPHPPPFHHPHPTPPQSHQGGPLPGKADSWGRWREEVFYSAGLGWNIRQQLAHFWRPQLGQVDVGHATAFTYNTYHGHVGWGQRESRLERYCRLQKTIVMGCVC